MPRADPDSAKKDALRRFHRFVQSQNTEDDVPAYYFLDNGGGTGRTAFSLHSHARQVAVSFFHSLSVLRKCPNVETAEYLPITPTNLDPLLRQLLTGQAASVRMYHVDDVLAGVKPLLPRRQASPGDLSQFEDCLGDRVTDKALAFIAASPQAGGGGEVSVSVCSPLSRTLFTVSVANDRLLTGLLALLGSYGVAEAFCLTESTSQKRWYSSACEIFRQVSVLPYSVSDALQGRATAEIAAGPHLSEMEVKTVEMAKRHMSCTPRIVPAPDLSAFLKFDANFARSFHVAELSKKFKPVTSVGRMTVLQWLKHPLVSASEITARQDAVAQMLQQRALLNELRGLLGAYPRDVERLVIRLSTLQGVGLREIYRLYSAVLCTANVSNLPLPGTSSLLSALHTDLRCALSSLRGFVGLVEKTIDFDAVASRGEVCISPAFHPELAELAAQKEGVLRGIRKEANRAADKLGLSLVTEGGASGRMAVKLERDERRGYFMRVGRTLGGKLNSDSRFHVLESRRDGIRFTTSKLSAENTRFESISTQYEEVASGVVSKVVEIAASHCPTLHLVLALVAQLDCLAAFAAFVAASPFGYCRPELVEPGTGTLVLAMTNARHPLIDGPDFVSNSFSIDRNENSLTFITGPNMGGKTTLLRTIALNVVLAQVGMFCPAESVRLEPLTALLARVDASDALSRGMSTFMLEMSETARIISASGERTLVLIDELGRGTCTYDGFGLAAAVARHMLRQKIPTVFSTHFNALRHVGTHFHLDQTFVGDKIVLLYKLVPGTTESSFGIDVAAAAGLPEGVVRVAREKLKELEAFESSHHGRLLLSPVGGLQPSDMPAKKSNADV